MTTNECFYIVRNAKTNVHSGPRQWAAPGEKSNSFPTEDIAISEAKRWAQSLPGNEYLVYEVRIIGRAAPSLPPVTYTDYRTGEQS